MPNERLAEIWDVVVDAARRIVEERLVSEAELDAAGTYLQQVAAEGQLVDLIQLVCQTVAADQQEARRTNPNAQVLGPHDGHPRYAATYDIPVRVRAHRGHQAVPRSVFDRLLTC